MTDGPDLLISFYGDDFTGSTDAMEFLASAGLRTVLFLEAPSPEDLARCFLEYKRIGVGQFIISGWPEIAEVDTFGREVLPRVREAERHQTRSQAVLGSIGTGL